MNRNALSRKSFIQIASLVGLNLLYPNAIKQLAVISGDDTVDQKSPSFIILLFDALSARHMSLYGYPRNTTPNINRFASEATVFNRHYAAGNFTIPNTASLLTGTYPWTHRALHLFGSPDRQLVNHNLFYEMLKTNTPTTAYTHNLQTAYLLGQYEHQIQENYPIETLTLYNTNSMSSIFENDFPRGFDAVRRWKDSLVDISNSLLLGSFINLYSQYKFAKIESQFLKDYPIGLSSNPDGYLFKLEDTIDWIVATLEAKDNPYLAYFHLLPPHEPYSPKADYLDIYAKDSFSHPVKPQNFFTRQFSNDDLAFLRQRYDEYLTYTDAEFGRLIENLKKKNLLDSAYIIVTSDHGQLFERGIHGHLTPVLYEPLVHIPLIIRSPNQKHRQDVNTLTSIVDILPTLLHLSSQVVPQWCEGEVLPNFREQNNQDRAIFAVEAKQNSKFTHLTKATLSVIQWPYKLIHYRGYQGYEDVIELFDISEDPEEINNLAALKPKVVSDLKKVVEDNLLIAEQKAGRL